MQIDAKAPVVAKDKRVIKAPIEEIWRLLTEIDHWPGWNKAVDSARLDGPFARGAAFRWKSGGMRIVCTLEDIAPMTRLVWTGKAIGTRAIHEWTLTRTRDGVRLSTSESFDGWLVRLLRKTMQRGLERALASWLADIKDCAERSASSSEADESIPAEIAQTTAPAVQPSLSGRVASLLACLSDGRIA